MTMGKYVVGVQSMAKAVRIHTTGGTEVLNLEDHEPGAPGNGEARVRHEAIGLNSIDVYQPPHRGREGGFG
jgi:NADPH:quinone reductase-like Zn-dependent oxidoreductase